MFDRMRTARTTVDAERLKAHASELQALLSDASTRANLTAAQLSDQAKVQAALARRWAEPHIEHGVEWARPRVGKVVHDGRAKAAPYIETGARKALPVVDTAHDKLVEDLLPKVVAALNTAAAAATVGVDRAAASTTHKLAELGHVSAPKKSHKGRNTLIVLAVAAAGGAAYQAWRRSASTTDPWAEEPWEPTDSARPGGREDFQGVVDDVRHELGDAAEAVGQAAGGAVARTREATERAAERAREATEKAREATRKSSARRRASGDDTTTTQALPTTSTGDVDVTPADVADTMGTQLETSHVDTDDSSATTSTEDGDQRTS